MTRSPGTGAPPSRRCRSPQWIGQVELAEKPPSEEFAIDLDTYFATDGFFHRLWKSIKRAGKRVAVPQWFKPWVDVERQAYSLKNWEPLVVPGLLQTPEYARAVVSRQPGLTEDQITELVSARMQRQTLLQGDRPPLLWVVIDEGVLHRPVGGADIMRAQLEALVKAASHPKITIQVVPMDAEQAVGWRVLLSSPVSRVEGISCTWNPPSRGRSPNVPAMCR